MKNEWKKVLLVLIGVMISCLICLGIDSELQKHNNILEDNKEIDEGIEDVEQNAEVDENKTICNYDTGNVTYDNELNNYCQTTGFEFSTILTNNDINGFGKNLTLDNLDNLKEISDNIIGWWDKRTYFNNVANLDKDLKLRILLEYLIDDCSCINKEVIKENYEHLFGENIDFSIFNTLGLLDDEELTDNFVCTCYGSGEVGSYEFIKEEQIGNNISYYYNITFEDDMNSEIINKNQVKITFKLNNNYYNLLSIEKLN